MSEWIIEPHGDFWVVRDDLLPGGTKQRFLPVMMEGQREVVYAGPAWGGAAVGIAWTARQMGIQATLFYAARQGLTPRQELAKQWGARLAHVRPGYLSVVRARARQYCQNTGAKLLEWGLPQAGRLFRQALQSFPMPDAREVWVAAGSGTLLRALAEVLPVPVVGVQVGHALTGATAGGCRIIAHPLKFEQRTKASVPFPSCRHYDAKAWEMMERHGRPGSLFWNVMADHS
jgi:threonine dehydratase